MAEPVRGIKRRDRQGGRRSWWNKAELPALQKKELEEAAAEASSELDANPVSQDEAPKQPQRARRSFWSKGEKLGSAEMKALEQAADDSQKEGQDVPKFSRPVIKRRDRDGGRRSWWSNKEALTPVLKKELEEEIAANDNCSSPPPLPRRKLVRKPTTRRETRRSWWSKNLPSDELEQVQDAANGSPGRPVVQRHDGKGGARRSWWGRKENLPMKELEALAADDGNDEVGA